MVKTDDGGQDLCLMPLMCFTYFIQLGPESIRVHLFNANRYLDKV